MCFLGVFFIDVSKPSLDITMLYNNIAICFMGTCILRSGLLIFQFFLVTWQSVSLIWRYEGGWYPHPTPPLKNDDTNMTILSMIQMLWLSHSGHKRAVPLSLLYILSTQLGISSAIASQQKYHKCHTITFTSYASIELRYILVSSSNIIVLIINHSWRKKNLSCIKAILILEDWLMAMMLQDLTYFILAKGSGT